MLRIVRREKMLYKSLYFLWGETFPAGPPLPHYAKWVWLRWSSWSFITDHMRTLSVNERRGYICNVLTHWLSPYVDKCILICMYETGTTADHWSCNRFQFHDYAITRKHFPHCWPSVSGNHRSPAGSIHKGLIFRSIDVFLIIRQNTL